jgi:ArsR family transcriptional regulator
MKNSYLFKVLADETKYKILKTLIDKELCVCEIQRKIRKTQSNVSMHLTKLKKWKIIKCRKKGKFTLCSIRDRRIKKIIEFVERGDKK